MGSAVGRVSPGTEYKGGGAKAPRGAGLQSGTRANPVPRTSARRRELVGFVIVELRGQRSPKGGDGKQR